MRRSHLGDRTRQCNHNLRSRNPKLRESTRESWNFVSLLNYLIHRMLTSIQGKPWFRYWIRTTLTFLTVEAKNLPYKLIENNIVTKKLSYSVTVLLPVLLSKTRLWWRTGTWATTCSFPADPFKGGFGGPPKFSSGKTFPLVGILRCLLNPRLKIDNLCRRLKARRKQRAVEKGGKTRWHCD